jgi:hypothetical protein
LRAPQRRKAALSASTVPFKAARAAYTPPF